MNDEDEKPIALVRYLKYKRQYRMPVIFTLSIVSLIATLAAAYYIWFYFDFVRLLWSWGFHPVVWWKAILSLLGCLYLIIGPLLILIPFGIVIEIFKLYIDESENIQTINDIKKIKRKYLDHQKVFVVHGHDDGTKEKVSRFLERLKLEAVILHEQLNKGQTIIEKFENHASQAGFAIILLTPDDYGYSKNEPKKKRLRARQNVVLELGYFTSLLGRDRVFVLLKDDVEIPSDFLGVVYTPLDENGGWKVVLAKEMKSSNMDFDIKRVF